MASQPIAGAAAAPVPPPATALDSTGDAPSPAATSVDAAIPISPNCMVLGRILRELGALHLLQEFIDVYQNDSNLDTLHRLSHKQLLRLYQMPEALAIPFIEKCRAGSASTPSAWSSGQASPKNCSILMQILLELGLQDTLAAFERNCDTDESLKSLSITPTQKLTAVYGIPEHLAASFIEKCRVASTPVDPGHERWLKACLMLRACARAVRPYVAEVMQQLHQRVVGQVKEKICEYKSQCVDRDWNCKLLAPQDLEFDDRPTELQIVSLLPDGVATADVPHRLSDKRAERFLFSKHNTTGVFPHDTADGFRGSNFYMRSLPDEPSTSSERRFVMQTVCVWHTPYL